MIRVTSLSSSEKGCRHITSRRDISFHLGKVLAQSTAVSDSFSLTGDKLQESPVGKLFVKK
jgi:hypothetical protein